MKHIREYNEYPDLNDDAVEIDMREYVENEQKMWTKGYSRFTLTEKEKNVFRSIMEILPKELSKKWDLAFQNVRVANFIKGTEPNHDFISVKKIKSDLWIYAALPKDGEFIGYKSKSLDTLIPIILENLGYTTEWIKIR